MNLTTQQLLLAIAGMLAVTYGIRLSFLVFGHRLAFPHWLERSLRYVPAAVLTALIVPMALAPQGDIALNLSNAYLPGTVAAGVLAFYTRQTLLAIIGGFVVYGLWRWLL
ncbi:AzlD domain-containing protein [Vogesella oryzae]|uniref:AzlD domain-containing protein n=1 Tax=Vogesella oryzae TaxID=1735285 RepID=UPI0015818B29|nr:AzlD domain-containing protein [Vogesella oryzae]